MWPFTLKIAYAEGLEWVDGNVEELTNLKIQLARVKQTLIQINPTSLLDLTLQIPNFQLAVVSRYFSRSSEEFKKVDEFELPRADAILVLQAHRDVLQNQISRFKVLKKKVID